MARNVKKRQQTWYARFTVNPKYRKLIGNHETLTAHTNEPGRVRIVNSLQIPP